MGIRTDLAVEILSATKEKTNVNLDRISQEITQKGGITITEIEIKDEAIGKQIGKPQGKYITIEVEKGRTLDQFPDNLESDATALSEEINKFLPQKGEVLVVGLGNDDITPDALGPLVIKQIFATRHITENMQGLEEFDGIRPVSAFAPSVLGKTGLESAEIVKAICDKIKPSAVIVIDALASSEILKLGRTIQLSNTGISPGSGVKNSRKELSNATLGCPVISIGVPTVVDMHTIAETIFQDSSQRGEFSHMMVTPRFVDKLIEYSAKIISLGINMSLHPDISVEDIFSLTA